MELQDGILHIQSFLAVTIGIVVLFVGKRLNEQVGFLREFSIPEPVTGGLLFSVLFGLLYAASSIAVQFELQARDVLLVYFFTTIGINASARDLLAGGRPLLILLAITIAFMFAQNLMGIGVASLFGLPPAVGILGGSVSLIGGHGTTIAWAPYFIKSQGIANAQEIGIACATFGLILASLMGGPIAKLLINRYQLAPPLEAIQEVRDIGFTTEAENKADIGHLDFLDAVLAIHICIIVGYLLNGIIEDLGLRLPLFVTCLFAGILITNLVPKQLPTLTGTHWPTRTPAMALIADIALGSFLAMSLMSMQLWTLIDLGRPHPCHPGRTVCSRRIRRFVRLVPTDGQKLRCRSSGGRIRRRIPGFDSDRHGQYGRGHTALRGIAPCLHHRASGFRLFYRSCERYDNSPLSAEFLVIGEPYQKRLEMASEDHPDLP